MSDNDRWEKRVQQLEAEGLTRSDAQAVADAEEEKGGTTMVSHTPGPWFTSAGVICARHGEAKDRTIAMIAGNNSARDANARLIAAAPELLAACKMVAAASQRWAGLEPDELATRCKDAIAKATTS